MTPGTDPRLRRAFGHSLACPVVDSGDIGRDLALARGPRGLDLAVIDGIDNLGQALAIAITTALGSDTFNTRFGFDGINALAEEPNALLARERVRVAVIHVLRADPRVRDIVDVKLDDHRLDGLASGTRTLEVRLVFETITGERVNLNLGGQAANA